MKLLRASAAASDGDAPDAHAPEGCDDLHYGYALTCHLAQGSQWPRVLVKDESACFPGNGRRWLYTAVTRAQRELTLVLPAVARGRAFGWVRRR